MITKQNVGQTESGRLVPIDDPNCVRQLYPAGRMVRDNEAEAIGLLGHPEFDAGIESKEIEDAPENKGVIMQSAAKRPGSRRS